ncbi:hypothetical protein B0T16DRAFT_199062 [Cercophora newfieldiana]|uniref:C2H2-type domain-containing protein n=1 Tax=Cercophora newfieldiana TaxID=92897 RepID=A0AA40CN29_9PEZI|nr:hypothetical protein B0T16DRAFT_199062 [Cercophora newfieldiana]
MMAEVEVFNLNDLHPNSTSPDADAVASSVSQASEVRPDRPGSGPNPTRNPGGFLATTLNHLLASSNNLENSRKPWKPSMATVLGTGGFVIACVALWSTIAATNDGRKAKLLAEWTAKKDFLEFCQTTEYASASCKATQNMTLDPPPGFNRRSWRYSFHTDSFRTDSNHGILLPIAMILVFNLCLGCRRRVIRCLRSLRRRRVPGSTSFRTDFSLQPDAVTRRQRVRSRPARSTSLLPPERDHQYQSTGITPKTPAIFGQLAEFDFNFDSATAGYFTTGVHASQEGTARRRRVQKAKARPGSSVGRNAEPIQSRLVPLNDLPSKEADTVGPENAFRQVVGQKFRRLRGGESGLNYMCNCSARCVDKEHQKEIQLRRSLHRGNGVETDKNDAESLWHSQGKPIFSCSCLTLTNYRNAFYKSPTKPGEVELCGFCGQEIPVIEPGPERLRRHISLWHVRHLFAHNFGRCDQNFYLSKDFRQHIIERHGGIIGDWTSVLEEACRSVVDR